MQQHLNLILVLIKGCILNTKLNVSFSPFKIDKQALAALRNEFTTQKERLSYELSENWKDKIRFEVDEHENRIQIRLVDSSERDRFLSTLNAMSILSILSKKIDQLSKFLLISLFEPLIGGESRLTVESIDGSTQIFSSIKFQDRHRRRRSGDEMVADVWKLLENLIKLFDFKVLSIKSVDRTTKNFNELIGDRLAESILREIVVKILKPAVPSDKSESVAFEKLLAACESLEKNLKIKKFLRSDFKQFESFAADIDALFLNKRCQTILHDARLLITSNLHNTVDVGVGDDVTSLEATVADLMDVDEEKWKDLQGRTPIRFESEKKLPAMFRFPKCRVRYTVEPKIRFEIDANKFCSQTVLEFVQLLTRTLNEACESSQDAAGRLFETARYMLELFVAITPTYHKQALISMPLLPGNC